MQLGTALNLPNPRINFGGSGAGSGKGKTAIFSFETGALDPRINFSRTTNATVTNSAGLITYAPHNLLTYSEQFDNAAWQKLNGTSTSPTVVANNAVSPNNTNTADTVTFGLIDASGDYSIISQVITISNDATHTSSFYVKANSASDVGKTLYLYHTDNGVTVNQVSIDLTLNYQRITSTGSFTAGANRRVTLASLGSGLGGKNQTAFSVDVWGAQLEIGSTATTYNSTTVKNLLGYSELFDNATWTKSNSFVQTNLVTYSEDFSNAVWQKPSITVTSNSEIAPNGYQTADTLTATAGTALIQNIATSVIGVSYTVSIWVKRKTGTGVIYLRSVEAGNNLINVTNEWQRFSVTTTATSTVLRVGIVVNTSGDEVYVWGAQAVQGSVAGDYRRTDAAALPVYYPNHNGVVCAEKLVETAANNFHFISPTGTGTVVGSRYTSSIYVKAGERTWFVLTAFGLVNTDTWFNLSTGVRGTTGSNVISASIIYVGNGWYRCSISYIATGTNNGASVLPATGNGLSSYTGDGTSGIYIFGAQTSDSASLDPYVLNAAAAPTAAAYYGARFDYDPVTLAPKGLLIEEQRANLLLNSSLAGTNLATQNVTVTAVAHTLSFYGTGNIVLSGTASATLTGTGAYPTRSTLTFTPTAGTLTLTVTGTVQYAQLEIGSFATSFIPTAASQVTRAADVATIQGSNFYSWFNQNEGSIYANSETFSINDSRTVYTISDGTLNNRIASAAAARYHLVVVATSTLQVDIDNGTYTNFEYSKVAGAYKINDFASSLNSSTVGTDVVGLLPITNEMKIGSNSSGSTSSLNGHIKQISYYPQRLSDSVLKGLTA